MTKGRNSLRKVSACVLIGSAVLNLNGLSVMLWDRGGVFSLPMLAAAVIIILATLHLPVPRLLALFACSIFGYVSLGLWFVGAGQTEASPYEYAVTYSSSILIIAAVAATVRVDAGIGKWEGGNWSLMMARAAFLVVPVTVLSSPWIYPYYKVLPESYESRMAGFFLNPNEAGMASVIAASIVLAVPFRRSVATIAALLVCAAAVGLTFSKAAGVSLVVLVSYHLAAFVRHRKSTWGLGGIGVAALAVLLISDDRSVMPGLVIAESSDLTASQQRRILQLQMFFSGQLTDEVTTGRAAVLDLGLEHIAQNFPFGEGLGSFHHLSDGPLEYGVRQGVHNVPIMILGESGPVPAAIFAAFLLRLVWLQRNSQNRALSHALCGVMMVEFMTTHSALSQRYSNVALGILIGLCSPISRVDRRLEAGVLPHG